MEGLVFYLSLVLIPTTAVQFQVHSQDKSLVAAVGSDVLLPCTLSPPLPADGLAVRWFHNKFHIVAFLLKNGREDRQQQSADFRGRAFLEAGPDSGNLSLTLREVRLSDAGTYHCFVENSTTEVYEEEILELTVVGLGSPPLVAVSLQDSTVVLSCSSVGWFPEPTMVWKRATGDLVPAHPETHNDKANGLFSVQSSILLNDSSEGQLYCGLRQTVTGKETGVYVTVSDAMFPRTSPWAIVSWLLLAFIIVVSPVVAWLFYSMKKEKEAQLMEKDFCIKVREREIEWRKVSVKKESIVFDPLTAFHGLLISPDCRTISTTDVVQEVLENPERFDTEPCVLAQTPIRLGTHYWETEILERDGQFWSVGIAKESVRRTGGQRECPEAGIWAIRGTPEGYYALSTPPEPIISQNPMTIPQGYNLLNDNVALGPRRTQTVGTFLDYDNGKVSFYDVDNYECLYTFTDTFPEPVYPFYYVGPGISFILKP